MVMLVSVQMRPPGQTLLTLALQWFGEHIQLQLAWPRHIELLPEFVGSPVDLATAVAAQEGFSFAEAGSAGLSWRYMFICSVLAASPGLCSQACPWHLLKT